MGAKSVSNPLPSLQRGPVCDKRTYRHPGRSTKGRKPASSATDNDDVKYRLLLFPLRFS